MLEGSNLDCRLSKTGFNYGGFPLQTRTNGSLGIPIVPNISASVSGNLSSWDVWCCRIVPLAVASPVSLYFES